MPPVGARTATSSSGTILRAPLGRALLQKLVERVKSRALPKAKRAISPQALDAIQPPLPGAHPAGQRRHDHVLERPLPEGAQHGRGEQVQRDGDVTAGPVEPFVDLSGNHERAELDRGGAGQPGRLEGDDVLGNVGQKHGHVPAGPGPQRGE